MKRSPVFPGGGRALLALLCLTAACRLLGSGSQGLADGPECQSAEQLAATATRLRVSMTENTRWRNTKEGQKANARAARMYERALAQAERGLLGRVGPRAEECVPPLISVTLELTGDPEDLKAVGLVNQGQGFVSDSGVRILDGMIDPLRIGELVRIEHVRGVYLFGEALPQLRHAPEGAHRGRAPRKPRRHGHGERREVTGNPDRVLESCLPMVPCGTLHSSLWVGGNFQP